MSNTGKNRPETGAAAEDKPAAETAEAAATAATAATATSATGGPAATQEQPMTGRASAEQRALEIGITIAGDNDVIMLDEPTAGMSASETEQIVGLIERVTEGKTLIMVEHDMSVVFNLADRISVLVYGEIIACDTPERVREDPAVQEAYLGAALEEEH